MFDSMEKSAIGSQQSKDPMVATETEFVYKARKISNLKVYFSKSKIISWHYH